MSRPSLNAIIRKTLRAGTGGGPGDPGNVSMLSARGSTKKVPARWVSFSKPASGPTRTYTGGPGWRGVGPVSTSSSPSLLVFGPSLAAAVTFTRFELADTVCDQNPVR